MNKRDAWGSLADELVIVGLTGGIASGKSVFLSELKKFGCFVIDSDEIARRISLPGEKAFPKIVDEFGTAIVDPKGFLNRQALADIVFKDRDSRKRLEDITHPLVFDEIREEISKCKSTGGSNQKIIVVDVPLLVESGMTEAFDAVIVIESREELRIKRLVEEKGYGENEAKMRIGSQAKDADRLNQADIVVENNSDIGSFKEKAKQVWESISSLSPG